MINPYFSEMSPEQQKSYLRAKGQGAIFIIGVGVVFSLLSIVLPGPESRAPVAKPASVPAASEPAKEAPAKGATDKLSFGEIRALMAMMR